MKKEITKREYDLFSYFVSKAYKLKCSPFWEWVHTPMKGYAIEKIISGDWLAHENLREEDLDSFCLTLRLLIQDKDGFSIRCIRKIAESLSDIYEPHITGISEACGRLKVELNKQSVTNVKCDGSSTNKELFDIIFYGGLVHLNETKRDEFIALTQSGLYSYFLFQSFISVLLHYNNAIQKIAYHLVQIAKIQELKESAFRQAT